MPLIRERNRAQKVHKQNRTEENCLALSDTRRSLNQAKREAILRWQEAEVTTACAMRDGQRDGWAAGKRLINPEDVNVTRNQSVRPTADATSEHFKNTVHNRPEASSYEDGIEDLLDDVLPEGFADLGQNMGAIPDEMEIRRATSSCANHKASDSDGLSAEAFKALASNDEAFQHMSHYVVRFFTDPDLYEDNQGVIREVWVKPSGDPTVRSTHSNRARGRPCQTLRHGYRNTLRFFGFDDVGSVDLQTWMVEARDVDRWGARVEDKLGLQPGSFKSLYHAQNNFG